MGLNALFLGYGRMGAALGEAWLGAGLVDGIDAVDPIRAQDVQARLYRQAADLPDTPYDLVVMAVKPVMAREALSALPASQLQNATIISVMAGVPLQTLRASLPLERPVVRSMPNTAVMVRQGCVGLYADEDVSPALRQAVTSPNGTTHAAIEEFEQGQALRRLVDVAAAKAGQRSVELSGG